jgi:hypothetical protein
VHTLFGPFLPPDKNLINSIASDINVEWKWSLKFIVIKVEQTDQAGELKPEIPTTWEAEIKRIVV